MRTVLKLEHFRKHIRNAFKDLQFDDGEVLRRSVGPTVVKISRYYTQARNKGTSHIQ
jgi:hypothetical protein